MSPESLQALASIGSSITTSGVLFVMLYLERKRVDMLITYILNGKTTEQTIELLEAKK